MKIINRKIIDFFSLLLLCVSTQVYAVEEIVKTENTSDPITGHYMFQLLMGLLIVILSIIVLAWLAKRVNRLQSSNGGLLTVLGGISMGSRERVVLIQVGEKQILIGVAPGRLNTLHVLDEPVGVIKDDVGDGKDENFADKFKSIITAGGGMGKQA